MNMKQIISLVSGSMLISGVALAGSGLNNDFRPYLGAEFSYNFPGFKSGGVGSPQEHITKAEKVVVDKKKPGFGGFLGMKLHENFGAEIGYTHIFQAKGNNASGDEIKLRAREFHFDALGYLPVHESVEAIASVGFGNLKPKIKTNRPLVRPLDEQLSKSKTGFRLGLGGAYKFDENVSARLMVRHQRGNNKSMKKNTSVALAAIYTF